MVSHDAVMLILASYLVSVRRATNVKTCVVKVHGIYPGR